MTKHTRLRPNRVRLWNFYQRKTGHEHTKGRKESAQNSPKLPEESHGKQS